MNAYTNSPEKTLEALKRLIDGKTLKGLAELIMQEQGYVQSETSVTWDWREPGLLVIEEGDFITGDTLWVTKFSRNGLECKNEDMLELWMRVRS